MDLLLTALSYLTEIFASIGSAVIMARHFLPVILTVVFFIVLLHYWDHVKYKRLISSRIVEIDNLSLKKFKYFICFFLSWLGYRLGESKKEEKLEEEAGGKPGKVKNVEKTAANADVDVLVIKENIRYAVLVEQKKRGIGTKVFENMDRAMSEYNCQGGIIINNGFYSSQDFQEGSLRNIEMWDRKRIIKELLKLQGLEAIADYNIFYYIQDFGKWLLKG